MAKQTKNSDAPSKGGVRRHNKSNRKTLYIPRARATNEPEWNPLPGGLLVHRKHGNVIRACKGGFVSVKGNSKQYQAAAKQSEDVVAALKKAATADNDTKEAAA